MGGLLAKFLGNSISKPGGLDFVKNNVIYCRLENGIYYYRFVSFVIDGRCYKIIVYGGSVNDEHTRNLATLGVLFTDTIPGHHRITYANLLNKYYANQEWQHPHPDAIDYLLHIFYNTVPKVIDDLSDDEKTTVSEYFYNKLAVSIGK
jgi:hypothetical protein